jgi:hypothetical protein
VRTALKYLLLRGASQGVALNFAGGVFQLGNTTSATFIGLPGASFSRTDTNGTATALDLAGNVIQFATGVPRITNRGLLVEEGRTNLLLNSATLSTQTVAATAVPHTLSFYGTGTVTLTGASTAGPLVGTGANNRVTLTFTPIVGPLLLTVTGSVTTAQLEAGSSASSPIITTGAAGTRGLDTAALSGLASLLTPPFTTFVEWDSAAPVSGFPAALGGTGFIYSWSRGDSAPAGRIGMRATSGNVDASTTVSRVVNQNLRHAVAHLSATEQRQSANGSSPSGSTLTVPAQTLINIGRFDAGTPANGYIRRIRIIPRAVSDAELVSLTNP